MDEEIYTETERIEREKERKRKKGIMERERGREKERRRERGREINLQAPHGAFLNGRENSLSIPSWRTAHAGIPGASREGFQGRRADWQTRGCFYFGLRIMWDHSTWIELFELLLFLNQIRTQR